MKPYLPNLIVATIFCVLTFFDRSYFVWTLINLFISGIFYLVWRLKT